MWRIGYIDCHEIELRVLCRDHAPLMVMLFHADAIGHLKRFCFCENRRTGIAQQELKRLDYRMQWEVDFLAYLKKLEEKKPVIYAGDLNVAHQEIDLKNPKTNRGNAGFTDEERACFSKVLENGFIDTFRYFYPEQTGIYSWWSYRFQARAKNAGWRIDYFVVSQCLQDRLADAKIHTEITGSDHCPIELDIQ